VSYLHQLPIGNTDRKELEAKLEASMLNVKYTDKKIAAVVTDPKPSEDSNRTVSVATPETPEDEDVNCSDGEDDHSNPGGTLTKQFSCQFYSKSSSSSSSFICSNRTVQTTNVGNV